MTRYSEQLEHEAEGMRWQVTRTLDELRSRISPGQVVDQLVDYTREGSVGELVRNLGRDVKQNPLPLTLIGAGIAWMLLSNGRAGSDGHARSAEADDVGPAADLELAERASDASDAIHGSALETRERANAALGRAAEAMGETAASVSQQASTASRAVAHKTRDVAGKVTGSVTAAARGTVSGSRGVLDFCLQQPLVLAGLGLAVGAAIGATLPRTRTEDRLLGAAGDTRRDKASSNAGRAGGALKDTAGADGDQGGGWTAGETRPDGSSTAAADNPAAAPESLPDGHTSQKPAAAAGGSA